MLTGNCRHSNHLLLRARIERAGAAFGLAISDICTPAELMKL